MFFCEENESYARQVYFEVEKFADEEGTVKIVYLALSVPNKLGQQIFAAFADATDKKDRWKIFKPARREYWPESEIQKALATLTQDLQERGYTVEVVPISEYHGILSKRNNQAKV